MADCLDLWLGEDVAAHGEVTEQLAHLAVFGQTRKAGKTTTLRTIIEAARRDLGATVLVIRTGKGEIPFIGHASVPYFRERLTWQGVEGMVWTFLEEKPRAYRPIIMRAVEEGKPRSLEDVRRNIVRIGEKAKNGWVRDRTYELDRYFAEILPWLREHALADKVSLLGSEVNVVDLEGWPLTVQNLVIGATLERLMEMQVGPDGRPRKRLDPLIVVLPEARNFMPDDSSTTAKRPIDHFVREAAKLNLFLWIDSQALTGVDQRALRNFALQLQGVQTSDIEIRRICAAFEVRPKAVHGLKVGDFLLRTQDGVRTIHVPLMQPTEPPAVVADRNQEEDKVDEAERQRYEETNRRLAEQVATLTREVERLRTKEAPAAVPPPPAPDDEDAKEVIDLHVQRDVPSLTVHERVVRIDATSEDKQGQLGILIADGFFDEMRSTGPIGRELMARGWAGGTGTNAKKSLLEALRTLCAYGFLRELKGMFRVVPEAKARIRRVEEAA